MEGFIIQVLVVAILFLLPVWKIFKRAGLNPALSLTVLIPFLGLLLSGIILAASSWKLNAIVEGEK